MLHKPIQCAPNKSARKVPTQPRGLPSSFCEALQRCDSTYAGADFAAGAFARSPPFVALPNQESGSKDQTLVPFPQSAGEPRSACGVHHRVWVRTKKAQRKPIRRPAGRKRASDENIAECCRTDTRLASLSAAFEIVPTTKTRGCFATATDAHPHSERQWRLVVLA